MARTGLSASLVVMVAALPACGGSIEVVRAPDFRQPPSARVVIQPLTDEGRYDLDANLPYGREHGCIEAAVAQGHRVVALDPIRFWVRTPPVAEKDWARARAVLVATSAALFADSVVVGSFSNTPARDVASVSLQWLSVPEGRLLGEAKLETTDGYDPVEAGRRACSALFSGVSP